MGCSLLSWFRCLAESSLVWVVRLNRNSADAVLIGLEQGGDLQAPGVRAALATALFRDGDLSLVHIAPIVKRVHSGWVCQPPLRS